MAGAPEPESYWQAVRRFSDSYSRFPPGVDHELVLVNSNNGLTSSLAEAFSGLKYRVIDYDGGGRDIGAHQRASLSLGDDDWIMCLSSTSYARSPSWLKAFVAARDENGDGLYGSTSSFEYSAHIRTTGFFMRVARLREYPRICTTREECLAFESGQDSITNSVRARGLGAWVVTPDSGTLRLAESRRVPHVFRKGNQSNIWIYDGQTDLYDSLAPKQRDILRWRAEDIAVPGGWRRSLRRFRERIWR
ncbi:hypothetical protein [Labrys monachus]|uniref:Glycosyltransferase 2-like domain-containing protein n=1 Tax=Labrys monachus TaxID=217067 RepID=A0ABU0FD23_9HYPH|nr:hypothetical protein [Labrys monachus]MDQ0392054.1 hypothetical protein [Labrys monachus]